METNITASSSPMEIIRALIGKPHSIGSENDKMLVGAFMSIFREYAADYRNEHTRIDDNEKMYSGDHWSGMTDKATSKEALPEPSTPIVTSTVENIKADMSDEFPQVIIKADFESANDIIAAKVITRVMNDEDDVCGFEESYDKLTHDTVCDGWGVLESGWDFDANNGLGGSFKRYVVNKNFLCDPQSPVLQNGRLCFKIEPYPKDWFLQRYPEQAAMMQEDTSLVPDTHFIYSKTTAPTKPGYYILYEAWVRVYDPKAKSYKIHFVWIAGGQLLEDSAILKPEGYYSHGLYPFDICVLFPQKGSALGLGIIDHFKSANRLADRLDQMIVVNAYRASRVKKYVMDGFAKNMGDVANYEKEMVVVNGPPASGIEWEKTPPLPSYIFNYVLEIRQMIKNESGANDQSRGQTSSGVTAGTAIAALQDMSLKRSRRESRNIAYAVRQASIKQVTCLREFDITARNVAVSVNGKRKVVNFDRSYFDKTFGEGKLPVEHFISLKTARQTRGSILEHNEIWLKAIGMLGGSVDIKVMLEGLIFEDKEELLENITRAQENGFTALQQQLQILSEQNQQLTSQVDGQREVIALNEGQMAASQQQQQGQQPAQAVNPAQLAQTMA